MNLTRVKTIIIQQCSERVPGYVHDDFSYCPETGRSMVCCYRITRSVHRFQLHISFVMAFYLYVTRVANNTICPCNHSTDATVHAKFVVKYWLMKRSKFVWLMILGCFSFTENLTKAKNVEAYTMECVPLLFQLNYGK